MIKVEAVWMAVEPLDMRSGTKAALARVVTLQARSNGNVYDVTATLGPGCPIASGLFTGQAIQAYVAGNVFVLLESPNQGGVMLLLGDREAP